MPCRFSSAVHRFTQKPHGSSMEKFMAISRWYEGRLSSVSRFCTIAVWATSDSLVCSGSQSCPPRA
jgi:hypothetical protein